MTVALLCAFQHGDRKPANKRSYYEQQGVVWHVDAKQKVIALTFDDGPNPNYTPKILELLKKHQAKCTFFVTGMQVKRFPEMAKRQVGEGHELGNHTFYHRHISRQTASEIRQEIADTEKMIVEATGARPPHLFRPPGGYLDDTVVQAAKREGYTIVLWSFHQDTKDWRRPGVRKIVASVTASARSGDIVLLHDHGGNRSQTVAALEQILSVLGKQGYRFVTVSDMLQEQNLNEIYRHRILVPGNDSP
jgi:peptidoglycan/xylan/chitin deacetylase (PgdA/CDA1 family)